MVLKKQDLRPHSPAGGADDAILDPQWTARRWCSKNVGMNPEDSLA